LTVDVSKELEELITKLVPAVILPVGADNVPCVPPGVFAVRKILEAAVTAVVDTVTVPALMAADVPIEALVPVAMETLFPAVPRTRLPLVAVMLPDVAVIDPGAVKVVGMDKVTVAAEPVVVISLVVPAILMLPADGATVLPVSAVSVARAPEPPPVVAHVAVVTLAAVDKPTNVYEARPTVSIHGLPIGNGSGPPMSVDVGALVSIWGTSTFSGLDPNPWVYSIAPGWIVMANS